MVHGFESGLVGWFWFKGSRAFAVRMLAVALASGSLTGAPLLGWYTHPAVSRRPPFLTTWAVAEATENLHDMVAGFPPDSKKGLLFILRLSLHYYL